MLTKWPWTVGVRPARRSIRGDDEAPAAEPAATDEPRDERFLGQDEPSNEPAGPRRSIAQEPPGCHRTLAIPLAELGGHVFEALHADAASFDEPCECVAPQAAMVQERDEDAPGWLDRARQ